MGVLQSLEHLKLVIDHPLVALYILLQDDLDGDFASRALSLAHHAVSASTKGSAEFVFGPIDKRLHQLHVSSPCRGCRCVFYAYFLS